MSSERYFVRSGDRDKGPFTLEQLRDAVAQTAISSSATVRAEGETEERPLADLLRGRPKAEDASPSPRQRRSRPRRRASLDLDDVYAPPAADEPVAPAGAIEREPGNYWLGFALGFFGGCIALVLSGSAKPETRKGIITGFGVGLALGLLLRVIAAGR